jgi:hypothetical protein
VAAPEDSEWPAPGLSRDGTRYLFRDQQSRPKGYLHPHEIALVLRRDLPLDVSSQ